jgi:hypothetical protein
MHQAGAWGVCSVTLGTTFCNMHPITSLLDTHSLQVEVIGALTRIRVECAKVLKMSLFNTYYTKSSRLDEFEQSQSQNTDQVGRGGEGSSGASKVVGQLSGGAICLSVVTLSTAWWPMVHIAAAHAWVQLCLWLEGNMQHRLDLMRSKSSVSALRMCCSSTTASRLSWRCHSPLCSLYCLSILVR